MAEGVYSSAVGDVHIVTAGDQNFLAAIEHLTRPRGGEDTHERADAAMSKDIPVTTNNLANGVRLLPINKDASPTGDTPLLLSVDD
jgi:hypothetical protein